MWVRLLAADEGLPIRTHLGALSGGVIRRGM
jgi:hypothetical protein